MGMRGEERWLTGGVGGGDVEAEDAEEEYDQLPSLQTLSEDLWAAETEVIRIGGGRGRERDAGRGRWCVMGCIFGRSLTLRKG